MSNDKKRRKIIVIIVIVLVLINIMVFGILFSDLSKYIWPEVEIPIETDDGYQLSSDGTVTIDGITYKQKDDGNFIVLSVDKTIVNVDIRDKINETDEVSVNEIGERAFEGCTSLISLNISSTITKINDYAFSGCNQLSTITIPYSVIEIGDSIFYECTGLSSIKVAVANEVYTHYNGVLYDINGKILYAYPYNKSDEEYKLSDNLERIENNVFRGFEKLKSVSLPENLTYIGDSTFENCTNLEKVVIFENVTEIGNDAFANCSDNLVIYGKEGSYAETYAKENNITFKLLDELYSTNTSSDENPSNEQSSAITEITDITNTGNAANTNTTNNSTTNNNTSNSNTLSNTTTDNTTSSDNNTNSVTNLVSNSVVDVI